MTRSEYAIRMGLRNTPDLHAVNSMGRLCEEVLEAVRLQVGSPIIVSSGYRSPAVNLGIGGSPTSQHMIGEACDFTIPDHGNMEAIIQIVRSQVEIPFDQLIYEGGESGWIHISHASFGVQRRRVLSADFSSGKAVYSVLAV
jgi:hypothetical protein